MVDRKEVEALLAYVEMRMASDKVELPPSVSDSTLAALCRTWLEVNREPSDQNQETQKEDPFDYWFAEHYPDIAKLGKDDPLAAGFRYAMRSKFNSGRNLK